MKWHHDQHVDDPKCMRHPVNSKVWSDFDVKHTWFTNNPRNVRLGLASDGFNPFNNIAKPYSIWPMILVPYNLPLCLCMKDTYFILSLLILRPKAPINNIDVYLHPLID